MIRKVLKLGAVAAVIAASAWGALALNFDQTRNTVVRLNQTQQTTYLRVTVNWNDPRISTGQKWARLPSNAFVNRIMCHVTTTFNAGTTNVVTFGTTAANSNEIIDPANANSSINEASATVQDMTASNGLGTRVTSAGEVDLYAKYAQTGAAATQGSVTCVFEYIPDNDQ